MRKTVLALSICLCLAAMPALAGEVTITGGQAVWKSTQCNTPAIPPAVSGVDKEAAANDVNARVTQYNVYSKAVQSYMDCMSNEAQADANAAGAAVVSSAEAQIADVKKHADALAAGASK